MSRWPLLFVMTLLIVLNGGSSSRKSTIARALQEILPTTWLRFGVDVLIESLPGRGNDARSGIVLEPDGGITITPAYRAVEDAWYAGSGDDGSQWRTADSR